MNVYDKAYELAKAMRESQEAKELKEARNRVNADSDAKRMLDDFRSRQRELQQKMMGGEEPQAEDMEKLNKLYEVLSLNPLIHKLFEAERRFTVIFDDVNRIMSEAIQNVIE
ncbi:YlbF family regulator [uncultured Paenibacillus sp.]|uniref:YlbF family regulator n=1 Tax=uncultured Paenibacillus sp. TaxID=227322 RepID=UPI0028D31DC1|nr:YlbF family regulator [uncultured Paenibacillus sp.]